MADTIGLLIDELNHLTTQLWFKSNQVEYLARELAESQRALEKALKSAKQADDIAKMRSEDLARAHQIVADMDATVRTCVLIAGKIIGGDSAAGQ
jgi:hypothetical protein